MDVFFEKHRKEVQKLCGIIATEISEKYNLDKDEITTHLDNTMFKKPTPTRCDGYMKGNHTQCTMSALDNERFCRRHLWCSSPLSQPDVIQTPTARCKGINKNGTQCTVRATIDGMYCKKHMFQDNNIEQNDTMKCIHFEVDEEGQENFNCDHLVLPNKWCCTKHKAMNSVYIQLFNSKSPSTYMACVESGTRKTNDTIIERIKGSR
jgi:hypothetical protein